MNKLQRRAGALKTLVEVLQWRANAQPDRQAYVFLSDGEEATNAFTYAEFDRRARAIAAELQSIGKAGDRALLLYPTGLDYLAAFFGCLYAGIVAVPAYPPAPNRPMPRLQAIAADAQATLLLTTAQVLAELKQRMVHTPELQALQPLATDMLDDSLAQRWSEREIRPDSLAFLQYTSGSTATPKGVMVSHANLMHNQEMILEAFEHSEQSTFASWLPIYHDMGLIGNLLQPLYIGALCVLMPPVSFLQQPYRWLQAISRYQAQTSGGPNFAYELCVRKITAEQKASLDLSSWSIAYNGSEPVRYETLERFSAAFAECGFRREAFYPCYGLAEATLLVSGSAKALPPVAAPFLVAALEQHQVRSQAAGEELRTLVGCGQTTLGQQIVIADPERQTRCGTQQIGEIWVSGGSIARGYWNRPEESRRTFEARLADSGEGPFLRTGDLGFLWKDQLFITGRLKDLVIINGRNHYPQDIELTIESSHPALRPGCGAAFSIDVESEERLVIVQEVERPYLRKLDLAEVVRAIREAVATQHELDIYAIALLRTGTLPKTSSGKIQHHACKAGFLEKTLTLVGEWVQGRTAEPTPSTAAPSSQQRATAKPASASAAAIQSWLVEMIAQRKGIACNEIDVRQPFASFGLSSIELVGLSGELESWLRRRLAPTLAYSYPSIEALANHLAGEEAPAAGAVLPLGRRSQGAPDDEPIAVIGMGCRFPGASSPADFWRLLQTGVDAVGEVPPERWDVEAYSAPDASTPEKLYARWGGFLRQIDQFDPYFFGISPREAEQMDPQQRLLLEVCWETLEHAGIAPGSLAGQPVGVFIGISNNEYAHLRADRLAQATIYTSTGNALSIAANRLSYQLDLRGPALAVDTACSSSLVAVHLACQSLRQGESRLALAGGVNLILSPELTLTFSHAQMLSPEGRCKTFDASANGYVRGEGCGMVLLKRLSDALEDGDTILALIRGSAVNQDGRSNGLTAPNGLAQAAVIRQAQQQAGVSPGEISYVEAHGSATALGDPIEIGALKQVLLAGRTSSAPCWIGSVKSNIGHLEAASGIAGLLKVVLALQHGQIPPNLHFKQINPHIDLADTALAIPIAPQPWPESYQRRLAGVSSFGFGGTNAHIVVEAAPARAPADSVAERSWHILAISARDAQALRQLAGSYAELLRSAPETPLADLCFTANTGRAHFAHRLACVGQSAVALQEQLEALAAGQQPERALVGHGLDTGRQRERVAFVFTGQGSQYYAMGRELYATQPLFRQTLDKCDALLRPHLPKPLLALLYSEAQDEAEINQTLYAQPALFALEYALACLLRSWGITPDVVLGHSLGEYTAACIAGVFSLEDGLRLIVERARLMQGLPANGRMLAVFAQEQTVAAALEPYAHTLALAAVNGPRSCVISGEQRSIEELAARLAAQGVRTVPLNVSHAFHSPLMEPILASFEQALSQVSLSTPTIALISNLSGAPAGAELATPAYWVRHLRESVRFAQSVQALQEQGCTTVIEVGPDPVLLAMARQSHGAQGLRWLPTLRKRCSDWEQLLLSLGALYTSGAAVDWLAVEQGYARGRLALPTYPWQRQRYWLDTAPQQTTERAARQPSSAAAAGDHPLLGRRLDDLAPIQGTQIWELQLDKRRLAYLEGHRVAGAAIAPVSVYVEMARKAALEGLGDGDYIIEDLELHTPLFIREEQPSILQLSLANRDGQELRFQVHGRPDQRGAERREWVLHASAAIRRITG